jgi:UDP-N-acetylglucosamine transferase subunit ALG13
VIFVATGTQFPFDRLIRYMDEWAAKNEEKVFAQLGDGEFQPKHLESQRFISLDEYNKKIQQASVFISHAGMGNIISAKEHDVPIIVINRQASLGEHRNDHQTEGLSWMAELDGVYTATTQEELYHHINNRESLKVATEKSEDRLLELVDFVDSKLSDWRVK